MIFYFQITALERAASIRGHARLTGGGVGLEGGVCIIAALPSSDQFTMI